MLGSSNTHAAGAFWRPWAGAAIAVALALVAAGPARAEYHCSPGTPIPGGTVGATFTIAAPGCFFLATNRIMTGAAPAINITASHVHLDLRGHTLGHAVAGQTIINAGATITDVHVVNGKLAGASGGIGVNFVGQSNGDFNISDLVIGNLGTAIPGIGIQIAGSVGNPAHAVIARNTIDVLRSGIQLDRVDGGRIADNVLIGRLNPSPPATPTLGIWLNASSGNDVRGNTISDIFFATIPIGTGILLSNGANFNNVQHNTISRCYKGISVDNSNCNTLDWNVSNGNVLLGIELTTTTTDNIYSFNRSPATCNAGSGLVDLGVNVNAGNNF